MLVGNSSDIGQMLVVQSKKPKPRERVAAWRRGTHQARLRELAATRLRTAAWRRIMHQAQLQELRVLVLVLLAAVIRAARQACASLFNGERERSTESAAEQRRDRSTGARDGAQAREEHGRARRSKDTTGARARAGATPWLRRRRRRKLGAAAHELEAVQEMTPTGHRVFDEMLGDMSLNASGSSWAYQLTQ